MAKAKVIKLHPQPLDKGQAWFMTDDLQVGRRLRFRSYKLKDEMIYKVTGIIDRHWKVRKSGQAERTNDRVRMISQTGEAIDRVVMGLRISVNWELLDDH